MHLVSNSGPILSFARANRLDVLEGVVEQLFLPEAVYDDIVVAGKDKPGAIDVAHAVWMKRIRLTDISAAALLSSRLHAGECQAIALAQELKLPLLVDEREARKVARNLRIPFLGSLRILREAKHHGVITEIEPVVQELIRAGIYISDAVLRDFLREVGER